MDDTTMNNEIQQIKHIMENDCINIRKLKKQELIKINEYYGYKFKKKKYNRKFLIQNLLPIHRKEVLKKNIVLEKEDCPICFLILKEYNYAITNCGHAFCRECIFLYITNEKENCPLCREPYGYDDFIKPLTPTEVELLLFLVGTQKDEENNMNSITITQPSRFSYYYFYIFNRMRILYKLFFILLKIFLFFKSVEFLYILIIDNEKYDPTLNHYFIIESPALLSMDEMEQCVATY